MSTAFAAFVAAALTSERFTIVDVGCSGGIDPAWRVFGDRLRAVAFDASVDECERLSGEETHPDIRYIAGFVGLPSDHPFAKLVDGKPRFVRNPFSRFSAGRMAQLQQERLKSATLEEKLQHNAWNLTKLADPNRPVIVPEVLMDLGWSDVDLLKIDIDGSDFEVLHSFDGKFDDLGLIAARLEVNLIGGANAWEHAFHNTERFMRAGGFELLALDVRTYSMHALPAPFAINSPAQTVTGRPFQAEAFYARDPAGPDWTDLGKSMRPEKLAKLAGIFSVWNQPRTRPRNCCSISATSCRACSTSMSDLNCSPARRRPGLQQHCLIATMLPASNPIQPISTQLHHRRHRKRFADALPQCAQHSWIRTGSRT